jgi:short-subunit dehydrogenase
LLKNAKVYMASRSKEKAESAIKDLKKQTGHEAVFLELDLASLDSVRKSAAEFKRSLDTSLTQVITNDAMYLQAASQNFISFSITGK